MAEDIGPEILGAHNGNKKVVKLLGGRHDEDIIFTGENVRDRKTHQAPPV